MKFWELTSAFRDETNVLVQVLKQDKWAEYFKHYKQLDQLIQKQQRDILDAIIPFDLAFEVAEKSQKEYWLAFNEQLQVLYSYKPAIDDLERLLSSEVLARFGGGKLEEAQEYSCANVQPKPLNGNVEVIRSFNLTSVGLVAVLRTQKHKLVDNCNLSAGDANKSWVVTGEFKQLVADPYSAYEKLEAQKKQNIWHYRLKGMGHSDKPRPGTILTLLEHTD